MADPMTAAVAAVRGWVDWSSRLNISLPAECVVGSVVHAYASALVPDDDGWFDIASVPEGVPVQLFWEYGERGVGGQESAMVFRNPEGGFSFWTHGGPNSGSDWEPANREMPTHWRPQPPNPRRVLK